jgi:hypothetical protein
MSKLPIELLVGKKSAKRERMTVRSDRQDVESRRQAIRDKVGVAVDIVDMNFLCCFGINYC